MSNQTALEITPLNLAHDTQIFMPTEPTKTCSQRSSSNGTFYNIHSA
jgi:hypothetical protein